MGMFEVSRWLRGSHQSLAESKSATTLAGLRRLLVAAYNTSVDSSEKRMRMPLLDNLGAGKLVQGRAP